MKGIAIYYYQTKPSSGGLGWGVGVKKKRKLHINVPVQIVCTDAKLYTGGGGAKNGI